ncbi:MAG: aldose 1-epimerase [Clostridia bacterium]|nr:aldose 1-epimerase [Clostridia bacterium]
MIEKRIIINSPDNMWHAEICACRGANIEKLLYNGENVLNPLKSERQWEENPFICGSPLLFPANRTAGGRFSFGGKDYHLPITDEKSNVNLHGSLYCQTFSVKEITSNSVVLQFENNGEIYPFDFSLTVEYTLENGGLTQSFIIKNCGKTDMPYTFALHTTFYEPDHFSVPISLAEEKDARHIPTGRYIPLSEDEALYAYGIDPRGRAISGYYKANGNTAVVGKYSYTVSDQFDHFVLYNGGKNNGYLCIEPQVGAVDGLNITGGCRVIPAGKKDVLHVHIRTALKA